MIVVNKNERITPAPKGRRIFVKSFLNEKKILKKYEDIYLNKRSIKHFQSISKHDNKKRLF